MSNISLLEFIRYVFSGAILYICLYIFYPEYVGLIAEKAGVIGFPIIMAVIGILIYFLYRPLIYDPLIERLQYKFNPFGKNYRQELTQRYKINFEQATRLFILIRDNYLKDKYHNLKMQSAGIHMMYQASIIFSVVGLIVYLNEKDSKSIVLMIVSLIIFIGAYLQDSKYEILERDMLLSLGWDKIDEIAFNIGYKKRDTKS